MILDAGTTWLVVGLVLMLAEIVLPGVLLLWIGLAALGTGLVVLAAALPFWGQVVVFGALAAVTIAIGLRVRRSAPAQRVNTPDSGLVGRTATALAFSGREGRVHLGDSEWSARLAAGSPPPDPGARMQVVAVEGTVLVVRTGEG